MKHFEIAVVGGGHAGVEAAWFAAKMGLDAAIITMDSSKIGEMSCNPAIGGVGKGHIVREIDALGGLMGRAADATGIQFRLLNRKKGAAVQGPRAQSDRARYRDYIQASLAEISNLTIIVGEVTDLLIEGGRAQGVRLADGQDIKANAVILTTGTFLNGKIHKGLSSEAGGRIGDAASTRLAQRLRDLTSGVGRLKTGTPPRLLKDSIDWERVGSQPGDPEPQLFSFLSQTPILKQVSCGITETNPETHEIIRKNLDRTALFGGAISGNGPRYCPSIEDKISRFSEKSSHQIFLEPEGLDSLWVYPNGISTSLDPSLQAEMVHSILGLEQAQIAQPGYAIEYDFLDPRGLTRSLESKEIPGLYMAGQINGTTGYEEAAAQGAVAGLCAGLAVLDKDPLYFSRSDSYIGVLVDDLTSFGVTEPYRMFTSRAEFRLHLRHDNADRRLTEVGRGLGVVCDRRWQKYQEKVDQIEKIRDALEATELSSRALNRLGCRVSVDGPVRSIFEAMALPDAPVDVLIDQCPLDAPNLCAEAKASLIADAQYAPYLERQKADIERLKRDEGIEIPMDFSFNDLSGLSNELSAKLSASRPSTIAQASRIEGMTPAALVLLASKVSSRRRGAAG